MPTETFSYTGAEQTFTVPTYLDKLALDLYGAGSGFSDARGADTSTSGPRAGGRVAGVVQVTGGETLYVYVGGEGQDGDSSNDDAGSGGFNGGGNGAADGGGNEGAASGGGAGATDLRHGGNALADRIAVAAGGASGGSTGTDVSGDDRGAGLGGEGGAATGQSGEPGGLDTSGGGGGTQSAGGTNDQDAQDGSLGQGGNAPINDEISADAAGGAGGGGYYGGASGNTTVSGDSGPAAAGGGGGSNFVGGLEAVDVNNRGAGNTEHGEARLIYIDGSVDSLSLDATSETTADLSWSLNSTDEDGVRVYRATSSGFPLDLSNEVADLAAGIESYTDTGLEAGTEYYWIVEVYGPSGSTASTSEVTDQTTIDAPSDLTASANVSNPDTAVDLDWTLNTTTEQGVEIQSTRGADPTLAPFSDPSEGDWSTETTVPTGTESHTVTGLLNGEEYSFRIRATGNDANSNWGEL